MAIHKEVKNGVTIGKVDNAKAFRIENSPDGKVKLTAVFDLKPDTEAELIIPLGDVLGILFLKNNEVIKYSGQGYRSVCKEFGGNQLKFTFYVPSVKDYIFACFATKDFQDAIVALTAR